MLVICYLSKQCFVKLKLTSVPSKQFHEKAQAYRKEKYADVDSDDIPEVLKCGFYFWVIISIPTWRVLKLVSFLLASAQTYGGIWSKLGLKEVCYINTFIFKQLQYVS